MTLSFSCSLLHARAHAHQHTTPGETGYAKQLTARMPSSAPANVRHRLLSILRTVGKIPRGIPLVGLGINFRIEVNVVEEINLVLR